MLRLEIVLTVICVLLALVIVFFFIVLCVRYKECVNLWIIFKLLGKILKNDEKVFLLDEEIVLK